MSNAAIPWILFPLHREAQPFRRRLQHRRGPKLVFPCSITHQPRVMGVAITGDSAKEIEPFLDQIARYHPASMVILAGFGGALAPNLNVGDLIFASEIIDEAGIIRPATISSPMSSTFHFGRLFTSTRLIGTSAEKRQLGESLNAVAVDMEASFVAHACALRSIPFGCLRAISDEVDTELSPGLLDCLASGRVSIPKLLKLIVRRPSMISELWKLKRATDLASRNLAQGLCDLVEHHAQPTEHAIEAR